MSFNINEDNSDFSYNKKFNPSLNRLNNLTKLENYVDSIANIKKINEQTTQYALLANDVIEKRFYHKYATHNVCDNWVAAFTELFFHSLHFNTFSLATNFSVNDILKKPYGYCTQINTVLLQLLKLKNINYKIINFKHHFAFMSYINEKWYYFDPDQKPTISLENRSNLNFLQNIDSMSVAYHQPKTWASWCLGNPTKLCFSNINQPIAPNALLIQKITKIFSRFAFLIPLFALLYLQFKNKKIFWFHLSKANNHILTPQYLQ